MTVRLAEEADRLGRTVFQQYLADASHMFEFVDRVHGLFCGQMDVKHLVQGVVRCDVAVLVVACGQACSPTLRGSVRQLHLLRYRCFVIAITKVTSVVVNQMSA